MLLEIESSEPPASGQLPSGPLPGGSQPLPAGLQDDWGAAAAAEGPAAGFAVGSPTLRQLLVDED